MRYPAANALMAAAPTKLRRDSSRIHRFQFVDYVGATALVAGARPVAGNVQIDADPSLKTNRPQYAVAGGKVDFAVAEVVDIFAAEGGAGAALGVLVVHHHQALLM